MKSCHADQNHLYYPILLVDELFDFEQPKIVAKVATSLKSLATRGGIVIVTTHKPQFWDGVTRRIVTMNAGSVLKDEFVSNI